ncbi:hypothetical protein BJ944DRAFT_165618 [Cunninghamella echinulata]|nr:hypothetical protein BJ944DRAFT_165618 [Cunninghamella echinulata]
MVAVAKWYVSYLNGSFSSRVPKGEWEKKPYNPVLGEQYIMSWGNEEDKYGVTNVCCEQTSHHPPITGFMMKNEKAGIELNGHTGQKTRFTTTSLICDQVGQSLLTLKNTGESYLITSPSLTVNGIWYAAPYVELTGNAFIQGTTGLYATFEFSSKGWLSGEKNHFKCYIRKNTAPKDYIYKIEGQWSGKSTITASGSKKSEPFLDVTELKPAALNVKALDEQNEMESRKIWQKVSEAIKQGDTQTAGAEKSKIENQKRTELAEREKNQTTWTPAHFEWKESEPNVHSLQRMLQSAVKTKYDPATNGNWVFTS